MTSKEHQSAAERRAAAAKEQERDELRTALKAERLGYEQRGLTDRAKAVDEQLRRLGPATTGEQKAPDGARGGRRTGKAAGNPPIGKGGEQPPAGDGGEQPPAGDGQDAGKAKGPDPKA